MLRLPNDGPATSQTLDDYLAPKGGAAAIIAAIAAASPALADRLAEGRLTGDPTAIVGTNDSGDKQKALDLGAHFYMLEVLRQAGVRLVLSEEAEEIVSLNADGAFDVAIDPIDGSGSIGIGAPLGLLFSILPAAPEGFLRPGRAAVAAGYVSFGHSCDLGFSLGEGVHTATYLRSENRFRMAEMDLKIKADAKTLAYNASNERHWPQGLQRWIEVVRAGKTGPLGRDVNMRWLGAAVGDLHRILLQGGLFLYPADLRKGYENGRLRTLYEAVPIAFLMEQAGGKATDGIEPILDKLPREPHEHTALVCGAANDVDLVARYLTEFK